VTATLDLLARHAGERVCYLQTTGRITGRPRTIEIWFATDGARIYLLSGGRDRAHWVRNLRVEPRVRVRIGGQTLSGTAAIVADGDPDDERARHLLAAKYQGWGAGRPLSGWARGSLPVVFTPEGVADGEPIRDGGQ
jgi:deazaflavin-dependent oxidoreductase (nitroreductase family)